MRRFISRSALERSVFASVFASAAAMFVTAVTTASSADQPAPQQIDAQLAAGEFGPALQQAAAVADPQMRDRLLGRIATAQAGVGAKAASYNTAAEIRDDRLRATALEQPSAPGAAGGSQANFTELKDLIYDTISPTTWDEVGGPGAMKEFRGGVYVDAAGVLRRTLRDEKSTALAVARLEAIKAGENTDARVVSKLRKVSLTRLEREVQLRLAAGRRPTDEMLALAGLEKIQYVLVYPETGDLVLAGPASAWQPDAEGRLVSQATGRPVLQLDDLVVILRHFQHSAEANFGCSINPREEALARTQEFLAASAKNPLKLGARDAWLKKLRNQMGQQDVVVDGVDPHTRVAQVLVEADYRMKLVGMGLEPGVQGIKSYLNLINVPRGEAPPPLGVLRWWFTLNYNDIQATAAHDAFELRGQGVQVQSENELLTALGKRVHTGESEPLNQQFAQSFTQHFAALAAKYPVYADLQNIFDLALACALIKTQDLSGQVGWHMTCFGNPRSYPVSYSPAPRTVESIINHRVVNKVHVVAGVSGGVTVNPWKFAKALKTASPGTLDREHGYGTPPQLPRTAWWWD